MSRQCCGQEEMLEEQTCCQSIHVTLSPKEVNRHVLLMKHSPWPMAAPESSHDVATIPPATAMWISHLLENFEILFDHRSFNPFLALQSTRCPSLSQVGLHAIIAALWIANQIPGLYYPPTSLSCRWLKLAGKYRRQSFVFCSAHQTSTIDFSFVKV